MDEKAIVRKMMKLKGYSQKLLAENAGLKRQSNVSEMIREKNRMLVSNLVLLLNAMDCELVIRSRTLIPRDDEPGRMYKPEFVVECEEKE